MSSLRFRRFLLSQVILVAAASVCSIALAAQSKPRPNFSGEWTLVLEKSDFGPAPPPASMSRSITHADPSLKYVTVQRTTAGETKTETVFSTDGKPQKNTVQGNQMVTTGKWEADVIVLSSTMEVQGVSVSMEERLALSEGGKTLTVTRSFTTPDGPFTMKYVLVKK